MTLAPVIETARLRLRPHVPEDFDAYAAFFASDRARYVDGPLNRRQAWVQFAADTGPWALFGFGAWAVDTRAEGTFVGQVGLNAPAHFPERELGWILFDGYEGKGFAHEAAMAVRDYAYETLRFNTLVSYIDPDNATSIVLAERLGAAHDTNATGPDTGTLVYRHPAPWGTV